MPGGKRTILTIETLQIRSPTTRSGTKRSDDTMIHTRAATQREARPGVTIRARRRGMMISSANLNRKPRSRLIDPPIRQSRATAQIGTKHGGLSVPRSCHGCQRECPACGSAPLDLSYVRMVQTARIQSIGPRCLQGIHNRGAESSGSSNSIISIEHCGFGDVILMYFVLSI